MSIKSEILTKGEWLAVCFVLALMPVGLIVVAVLSCIRGLIK